MSGRGGGGGLGWWLCGGRARRLTGTKRRGSSREFGGDMSGTLRWRERGKFAGPV